MIRSIAVLVVLLPSPAGAQFFNGNSLLQACTDNPVFVSGYAAGFTDFQQMLSVAVDVDGKPYNSPRYCLPAGATAVQVKDVICSRLEQNPAERHWQASYLAFNALHDAFPCPEN